MSNGLLEMVVAAVDEALANLHTACIARVTAVTGSTVSCKPVVARVVEGTGVPLPEFLEVPVLFMRGGANYDAHPVEVGDYALLVITERCIDNWYNGVNDTAPADYRMHDYSDGIAIVGVSPLSGAIPIPTNAKTKRVGDSEVTGDYEHDGDYVLTGNFTINGNLTVNGNGTGGNVNMTNTSITLTGGDISADGKHLKTHVHNGVQPGSGNTGQPV